MKKAAEDQRENNRVALNETTGAFSMYDEKYQDIAEGGGKKRKSRRKGRKSKTKRKGSRRGRKSRITRRR